MSAQNYILEAIRFTTSLFFNLARELSWLLSSNMVSLSLFSFYRAKFAIIATNTPPFGWLMPVRDIIILFSFLAVFLIQGNM